MAAWYDARHITSHPMATRRAGRRPGESERGDDRGEIGWPGPRAGGR